MFDSERWPQPSADSEIGRKIIAERNPRRQRQRNKPSEQPQTHDSGTQKETEFGETDLTLYTG